eukprot:comp24444_c0_seq1/m.46710 comp24444_c0_seq1/g.46710  ORF comp24444_c0_seq1/g.46710 comp24444_c0_seq1/m.46710 type:complete len:342 (-) comp24444_c0_seq1:419-1444(-)
MLRLALALMGASAALAVNPTSSSSSVITPDPSPKYTHTTTYIPTATDDYGAVSTHKVTSTRHINPTTFRPDPSAGCAGGIIVFTADGDITSPLYVGMWIAKVARISGTKWSDYVVYEADFNAKLGETTITALVCNKDSFDATMHSMITVPNLWNIGVGTYCNNFITSAGASRRVCTQCFDGEYLLPATGNCYPCTPVQGCSAVTCTNATNSVCADCDPNAQLYLCKAGQTYCEDNILKCQLGGCATYAYRNVAGQCSLCPTTGVTNCQDKGNVCDDLTGGNPTCGANSCNLGYQNAQAVGPCEPCSPLTGCAQDKILCTIPNDPNATCSAKKSVPASKKKA